MKLPDFTKFESLNKLRQMMGAELGKFIPAKNPETLTLEEIARLSREGIEIPLSEVRILNDGTLAYKNSRVVLYIRDISSYHTKDAITDKDMPRYHVSDCNTLQEMRRIKRYDRYVVATRDDGLFELNIKLNKNESFQRTTKRLKICQFCLGKIKWDNFYYGMPQAKKIKIVDAFTLVAFFNVYGKSLVTKEPLYHANNAPLNEYSRDFSTIADSIKRKFSYRCSRCNASLSEWKAALHVHHINGNKFDNSESNLKPLCIACHAEEPYHNHMKALPEYKKFLQEYRSANQRSRSNL